MLKVQIELPDDAVALIAATGREPAGWSLRVVYDAYLSLVRVDAEAEADAAKQRAVAVKVGRALEVWDPLTEVTPSPQPAEPDATQGVEGGGADAGGGSSPPSP